jgi:hypothetical protein
VKLENNKKKKEMGHLTKKTKAKLTIDHTGKLLRTNEELQKKKEESNGCKMKKTGDKKSYKKPRSVEQLKKPEERKTERTSKPELKLRDKEEKKSSKPKKSNVNKREETGKPLKKNADRKKKLACRPKKRKDNRDMSKLAKLLLSYKIELLKQPLSIFKKKCWPTTDLSTVLMFSSNLTRTIMVTSLLTNSKVISNKMRT